MEISRQKLREILLTFFSFDELRTLAFSMNIDVEQFATSDKSSLTRELIVFIERQNRAAELVDWIRKLRPSVFDAGRDISAVSISAKNVIAGTQIIHTPGEPIQIGNTEAANLTVELATLRQQLQELKDEFPTNEKLDNQISEALKSANRAVGRSEDLTARLILPPSEDTDVQLVPSTALDRLEEYRSDESLANLLTGVFAGAVLGVMVNWATSDNFNITRFSLVLLGILIALTIFSGLWIRRINHRASQAKIRLLRQSQSERPKQA